jgi:protein-S-isoprenylcysteine O-methyltransferase Ste14
MKVETLFRLIILAILGCAFLLSGLYRSKARKETDQIPREDEGWQAVILRLGSGMIVVLVILLDIFFPEFMEWTKIDLPLWIRILGTLISVGYLLWIWWVFRTIGNNISETVLTKENQELITTGPYRLVRHPLYAGSLLFLFSLSLILEDWLIFIFTVFGVLAFRLLVIPAEEEQLLESFGEEYESYQARTGALLPWIR